MTLLFCLLLLGNARISRCGKLQLQQWQTSQTAQKVNVGGKREVVIHTLSERPRLFAITNLIDDIECNAIQTYASPHLAASSTGYRSADGSRMTSSWRQSQTAWLNTSRDQAEPIIAKLNRRISKLLKLPLRVMDKSSFQVLRYKQPGHYHPHYDSRRLQDLGDNGISSADTWVYPVAARFATVLYFLNAVDEGGNVTFPFARMGSVPLALSESLRSKNPKAKHFWDSWAQVCDSSGPAKSFPPRKAVALLWYNHEVGSDGLVGELDPWSFHGGCPVGGASEKWIANHWINIRRPHSTARDVTVAADLAYKDVMEYFDRFSQILMPGWNKLEQEL